MLKKTSLKISICSLIAVLLILAEPSTINSSCKVLCNERTQLSFAATRESTYRNSSPNELMPRESQCRQPGEAVPRLYVAVTSHQQVLICLPVWQVIEHALISSTLSGFQLQVSVSQLLTGYLQAGGAERSCARRHGQVTNCWCEHGP